MESQALPFQIKVIEGELSQAILQKDQPPGVIQLVGRQLPHRPIVFGGRMRTSKVDYPGNPVASQQVIGPIEKNTTVTGEWNDIYLGDGQAMALREIFDTIRRRGFSVEVTWPMAAMSGTPETPTFSGDPIVRVGLMVDFTATIGLIQDVGWSMEFEWRSQGQGAASSLLTATAALNPRDGFADVVDDLDVAIATWQAVQDGTVIRQFGLPQAASDAFTLAFQAVDTVREQIERATGGVVSAIVIPYAASQQLIAACANGVQAMIEMENSILNIPMLHMEVIDNGLDLIRMHDNFLTSLLAIALAKETCADAAVGVSVDVEPEIVGEVDAPAGTDLRDIAIRFYGDPDMWWAIANYNDIDGSAVPAAPSGPSDNPARRIKLPRPQAGTSSDLRQQC
jgi:hypothetical protein